MDEGENPIPSLVARSNDMSTPLPKLPMTVLCIVCVTFSHNFTKFKAMLAEFLTANVSTPFLLFMIEAFDDKVSDPTAMAGVLVSLLFVTQFLTSLIWASLANKFGTRAILFTSLFGTSICTATFGLCTTLRSAMVVRLLHGVFLGAIGTARAGVSVVADPSNEARAYSIVAFSWSMGGVLGAILGGSLESPVRNNLPIFQNIALFQEFPYFLPCLAAASVTFIGSLLSLGLAWNGGPRGIRLQGEEETLKGVYSENANNDNNFLRPPLPSSAQSDAIDFRDRLASTTSMATRGRAGSIAASLYGQQQIMQLQDETFELPEPTFAQKLLEANELGAPSLSNLWFQAAIAADNEEVFEGESLHDDSQAVEDGDLSNEFLHSTSNSARPSFASSLRPSVSGVVRHRRSTVFRKAGDDTADLSNEIQLPTIFHNVGLEEPPAMMLEAPVDLAPTAITPEQNPLPVITEDEVLEEIVEPEVKAKPPSAFSYLPWQIIAQFAVLALHTTIHDQVFYSYLVSDYADGGLSLSPANFSQIIALMTFAQIFCQFVLYPSIGPPRGRFSHLAMFRFGSFLYIPAYLTVILYRRFYEDTTLVLVLLAISTALRFGAVVFSYTAISVMLNYASPPHTIGLANGISQSLVSAARFLGPLTGGAVWSLSVKSSPDGYPVGFVLCAGICAVATIASFFIR